MGLSGAFIDDTSIHGVLSGGGELHAVIYGVSGSLDATMENLGKDLVDLRSASITENGLFFPSPGTAYDEVDVNVVPEMQTKTVTPSAEAQVITADDGFDGLISVEVAPIPSNYGLVSYDGSIITVQ